MTYVRDQREGMFHSYEAVESVVSVQAVPLQGGGNLIELAILFLVLALVAAVLGARGVAGLSMDIAKWLVIIFVVLAIVAYLV